MTKSQNNTGALINIKHNHPQVNSKKSTGLIHVIKDRKHYLVSTLTNDQKPDRIFSEFDVDDQGELIIQPYLF